MKQPRLLHEIANEIRKDWKNVYFGARPYLDAMLDMRTMDERYFEDTGETMVIYFLGNAQTWRGEVARRIKIELNQMLKSQK